jgi:Flp pilus assembly protein TadD
VSPRHLDRTDGALAALLLAAVAAVFWNALAGDFVWDDAATVVNNARSHGLDRIPALLGWGDAPFGYRMLRDASYAVDYAIGGLNPRVYHASNLLYHAVTVVLAFLLMRRVTGSRAAAFWGGLVFAVHPVQADSVTYISGRRDLLTSLFYVAGLLAYIRYRDTERRRWLAAALGAGALGLMAKEMAATLPAAWFLYDVHAALGRGAGSVRAAVRAALAAHWRLYGAGLALAGAFVLYVLLFQPTGAGAAPHGGTWARNFMAEAVVLAHAARLLAFPTSLIIDYGDYFLPWPGPADPRLWGALVLLAAVAAGGALAARRGPAAFFAVNWVWITYLPVAQIIPHPELFAEHYLYLPLVGVAMLAGMGLAALGRAPGAGRAALALGAVAVVLLGGLTWDRNRDFRAATTVLEAQLRINPDSRRALNNLAFAYKEAGRLDDARRMWGRYLTLQPDDAEAWIGVGTLAQARGRAAEARVAFGRAAALNPEDTAAWKGLGIARRQMGNPAGAEAAFRRVLALAPGDGDAWNNLGALYALARRWSEAEAAFARAAGSRPAPPAASLNLARVRLQLGDCAGARAALAAAREEGGLPPGLPALARLEARIRAACPPTPEPPVDPSVEPPGDP